MSSSTSHRARQRRADGLATGGESPPDAEGTSVPPLPRKKAATPRRVKPRLQAVEPPADPSVAVAPPEPAGGEPAPVKSRRRKPADETAARATAAWVPLVVPETLPGDAGPDAVAEPKPRKPAAPADAPPAQAKKRAPAKKRRSASPQVEAADTTPAPPAAEPLPVASTVDETSAPTPAPEPAPELSVPVPTISRLAFAEGDAASVVWLPAADCPQAVVTCARDGFDAHGRLASDDDDAVTRLLRAAAACAHGVEIDARIWPCLAARRDARRRLEALQQAYPEGAADPGLDSLLRARLAPFQAEGALWAVVAGRALLADERGLGKGVQAIAAAQLWRRHFGLRQVLVVCAAAQCAQWRHAWKRFAGVDAWVLDRFEDAQSAHARAESDVRIVSPGAIAAGALAATPWAPQLAIVDEPQRLALSASDWSVIDAAQLLVLSGAALDKDPALLESLIDRLDRHRLGALAALREVQAARRDGVALPDAEIERLDARLSSLLLQRQRDEVGEQLPPRIWCARPVVLSPNQRAVHDRAWRQLSPLLAAWRSSGWLASADQWPVAEALAELRTACQRSDPADASSALAETTIAAIQAQLDEWAADGAGPVALCCASAADRDQLAQRLGARAGLSWVIPGEPVPATAEAVLLAGVPWDDQAYPDETGSARGRTWTAVVADRSFDRGFFDTLVDRRGAPAGPGPCGWLDGEPLRAWLGAIDAALRATVDASADPRDGTD